MNITSRTVDPTYNKVGIMFTFSLYKKIVITDQFSTQIVAHFET